MVYAHFRTIINTYHNNHSVSLGADPPNQITIWQLILSPQALKNLKSPSLKTKSLDNSNIFHMFNNNILISQQPTKSFFNSMLCYSSDLAEPNCHKTKSFYKLFFDEKHRSPQAIIYGRDRL